MSEDIAQAWSVTFTYRDDIIDDADAYAGLKVQPVGSVVLLYSHIQKALKRMRGLGRRNGEDNKRSIRYLCAGEFGESKGRAHWHLILYIRGEILEPPVIERNFDWDQVWPHGYSYWKPIDLQDYSGAYKAIHYLSGYILKPPKEVAQYGYSKHAYWSRKPVLGYDFFMQWAMDHVKQGLAVHDGVYRFSGVRSRNKISEAARRDLWKRNPWETDRVGSSPRKFFMTDRTLELFLEKYVTEWRLAYGKEPPMTDFLVENYFDPVAKREMLADFNLATSRRESADPLVAVAQGGSFLLRPQAGQEEGGVAVALADGTVQVFLGSEAEAVTLNLSPVHAELAGFDKLAATKFAAGAGSDWLASFNAEVSTSVEVPRLVAAVEALGLDPLEAQELVFWAMRSTARPCLDAARAGSVQDSAAMESARRTQELVALAQARIEFRLGAPHRVRAAGVALATRNRQRRKPS